MTTQNENSLTGKRILIPPARPEANPLLNMIERLGAEVVEFPKLAPAPPADYAPMDEAIGRLDQFEWLILSGSNCVNNFFERFDSLGRDTKLPSLKIAAIGHGAAPSLPQKLKEAGAEVTEVHGCRMIVTADSEMAERTFSSRLDAVALPNPTTVMFLLKGMKLTELDLEILKGTLITVVGPATAETAREAGLIPGLISKGHIADLRNSLVEFYKNT